MRGFWKRPTTRTYSYNLEVGEHYYSPMTSYLEAERGTRGDIPGALTFSERLARKWIHGRQYEASELRDRYSRASSLPRGEVNYRSVSFLEDEMASRASRAMSELRSTSASHSGKATSMSAHRQHLVQQQQEQKSSFARSEQHEAREITSTRTISSRRKIEDDVCKKVADIRMMPWSEGPELNEAQAASARARSRILELERELDEITKKALTTQTKALKTAKQLAAEAYMEDELAVASSTKKSRKIIMESNQKISQA